MRRFYVLLLVMTILLVGGWKSPAFATDSVTLRSVTFNSIVHDVVPGGVLVDTLAGSTLIPTGSATFRSAGTVVDARSLIPGNPVSVTMKDATADLVAVLGNQAILMLGQQQPVALPLNAFSGGRLSGSVSAATSDGRLMQVPFHQAVEMQRSGAIVPAEIGVAVEPMPLGDTFGVVLGKYRDQLLLQTAENGTIMLRGAPAAAAPDLADLVGRAALLKLAGNKLTMRAWTSGLNSRISFPAQVESVTKDTVYLKTSSGTVVVPRKGTTFAPMPAGAQHRVTPAQPSGPYTYSAPPAEAYTTQSGTQYQQSTGEYTSADRSAYFEAVSPPAQSTYYDDTADYGGYPPAGYDIAAPNYYTDTYYEQPPATDYAYDSAANYDIPSPYGYPYPPYYGYPTVGTYPYSYPYYTPPGFVPSPGLGVTVSLPIGDLAFGGVAGTTALLDGPYGYCSVPVAGLPPYYASTPILYPVDYPYGPAYYPVPLSSFVSLQLGPLALNFGSPGYGYPYGGYSGVSLFPSVPGAFLPTGFGSLPYSGYYPPTIVLGSPLNPTLAQIPTVVSMPNGEMLTVPFSQAVALTQMRNGIIVSNPAFPPGAANTMVGLMQPNGSVVQMPLPAALAMHRSQPFAFVNDSRLKLTGNAAQTMTEVRLRNGNVVTVPLKAALNMERAQGATILSAPNLAANVASQKVPVRLSNGSIVNMQLGNALGLRQHTNATIGQNRDKLLVTTTGNAHVAVRTLDGKTIDATPKQALQMQRNGATIASTGMLNTAAPGKSLSGRVVPIARTSDGVLMQTSSSGHGGLQLVSNSRVHTAQPIRLGRAAVAHTGVAGQIAMTPAEAPHRNATGIRSTAIGPSAARPGTKATVHRAAMTAPHAASTRPVAAPTAQQAAAARAAAQHAAARAAAHPTSRRIGMHAVTPLAAHAGAKASARSTVGRPVNVHAAVKPSSVRAAARPSAPRGAVRASHPSSNAVRTHAVSRLTSPRVVHRAAPRSAVHTATRPAPRAPIGHTSAPRAATRVTAPRSAFHSAMTRPPVRTQQPRPMAPIQRSTAPRPTFRPAPAQPRTNPTQTFRALAPQPRMNTSPSFRPVSPQPSFRPAAPQPAFHPAPPQRMAPPPPAFHPAPAPQRISAPPPSFRPEPAPRMQAPPPAPRAPAAAPRMQAPAPAPRPPAPSRDHRNQGH